MSNLANAIDELVTRRQILIFPQLFSRATCAAMITRLQDQPSTPAEEDTFYAAPPTAPQRQAHLMQVDDTLRQEVLHAFYQIGPRLEAHFGVPLTRHERPNFLRYGPGDFFRPHTDWTNAPIYEERRVSLILFLNDHQPEPGPAFSGGRLSLFVPHPYEPDKLRGVPIPPQAGLLLAFCSDLLHEVAPISAGERYTVATWLAS